MNSTAATFARAETSALSSSWPRPTSGAEQVGPQIITRHGEEVAVIIDMAEYRHLTEPRRNFIEHLMAFPKLDVTSGQRDVFAEIESERKKDFPRDIDLGINE